MKPASLDTHTHNQGRIAKVSLCEKTSNLKKAGRKSQQCPCHPHCSYWLEEHRLGSSVGAIPVGQATPTQTSIFWGISYKAKL